MLPRVMRIHPRTEPRFTKSEAEKKLWAELAQVSLDWDCFHSLRLHTRQGYDTEGDFVLVDPARGFVVLEVKGGAIALRDGLWTQNGQKLDRPPKDQAVSFSHKLGDALSAAGFPNVPFGAAVAFPDCDFSVGPQTGDLRGLVFGRRELPHLRQVLETIMDRALPPGRPALTDWRWVQELKRLWGETWVPTVTLADRIHDAEHRVSLDRDQFQLLNQSEETERALIRGGAGTGKTLIAMELCRRRAKLGQRTQYLCFTDALARAVQAQFGDDPLLRATTVRQLAVELLKTAGVNEVPHADKQFWDEAPLKAACDALPAERPDLLVVDEGQDFEVNDWLLAGEMGPRGLWVFMDERQAFWTDRAIPPSLAATLPGKFKLQKSYRCPSALARFAESYVDAAVAPEPPPADDFKCIVCDEAQLTARLEQEVRRLLANGARPEHIVVVSLSGKTRSALFPLQALAGVKAVHGDAPEAGSNLVIETFLRFKGLERPFVIVAELRGKHVTHYETRMHIALTRATVQAIVVADREAAQQDPRLVPSAR